MTQKQKKTSELITRLDAQQKGAAWATRRIDLLDGEIIEIRRNGARVALAYGDGAANAFLAGVLYGYRNGWEEGQ